ncbi:ATP-binding protein [Streptomyces sp. T028]|uniref:ATP-binding protein n=1 Tax=Streptomyces sp. T028 TaxID=3394379 RepID=UPI003A8990BD
MTEPVPDNPYGVHVPGSRDLLPWLTPRPVDDHPLVPWAEESHTGLWVDVDHARDRVGQFAQWLDRLPEVILPHVDNGHLVVVTGPVGMGKTTLIHQCVHLARQRLADYAQRAAAAPRKPGVIRPPQPLVAMTAGYDNRDDRFSRDKRGQRAVDEINRELRDRVVDALSGRLPDSPLAHIRAQTDVYQAFLSLSTLLAEQDALLLVIVPHMDWRDERGGVRTDFLRTCLRHARSRIVLFVEVSHHDPQQAHQVVEEIWGNPALTHLSLGSLTPEDTVKFSQSTRGAHPDPEPPLSPHADAWVSSDVRQLRKRCFSLAEEQRQRGAPVLVSPADLGEPALDLAAMARRSSSSVPAVPRQPGPPPPS